MMNGFDFIDQLLRSVRYGLTETTYPVSNSFIRYDDHIVLRKKQGLKDLIFAWIDFSSRKMVLRARLGTQNYVSIKQWRWVLIYIV